MGYTVCGTHNRRNCDACDGCPSCNWWQDGNLRTFKCPFNWCKPVKVCKACIEKYGISSKKAKHETCRQHSADFHWALALQDKARREGLPVISAGVSCAEGIVFAWTSLGNYRLPLEDYQAGLLREDKVVSLDRAIKTTDERPPEVYG